MGTVALAVLALLAGCQSTKDAENEIMQRGPGLEAALRSPNSAATGVIRLFDVRDGVSVQMTINNLLPGTYRISLHETGNCSSRNLFSAGPAWAPPGSTKPPGELLPEFIVNPGADMTIYVGLISGARTDGPVSMRKRSVIVHWGAKVGEAFPGQPNNRLACGVLDTVESPR